MVTYCRTKLSEEKIFNYLSENDCIFKPKLSTRTNIGEFSKKLHKNAIHFCAFDGQNLVGLIACYFNDPDGESGFISSVSVKMDYQGIGIIKELLSLVVNYGKQNKFSFLGLEVRVENDAAKNIYKKAGFYETGSNDNFISMKLNLKD
jgi:ribosomal protein S18 acetylase RimI-like enzyme